MNDMELTRAEHERRELIREIEERWAANGNDMGRIAHEHATALLRLRRIEEYAEELGRDEG